MFQSTLKGMFEKAQEYLKGEPYTTPKKLAEVNKMYVEDYTDFFIRSELRSLSEDLLERKIRDVLIGSNQYHEKQIEVLNCVEKGDNVLALFPTARGKSVLYLASAATQAIQSDSISIFTYPLRVLLSDQFHDAHCTLSKLGIKSLIARGGISKQERETIFETIKQNKVDIIFTTPEFLYYYRNQFSCLRDRIALFVLDEGHHVIMDKYRPCYQKIDEVIKLLGCPQVIITTANMSQRYERKAYRKT